MLWCIEPDQNEAAVAAARVGTKMPERNAWVSSRDPSLKNDKYFDF